MRISPIEAIRQSRDVRAAARHGGSGRLSYRLFGLPGRLSSRYFHRSRKKYRATIFSLAMSVLLFRLGEYLWHVPDGERDRERQPAAL